MTAEHAANGGDAPDLVNAGEASQQELAARALARRHFLPFVHRFVPGYEAGWFHKDLAARLEQFSRDVADKKSPRLMLFVPPRHGKSEQVSRCFPAWHLGHYPNHEFIAASYSGSLSMGFSRSVRQKLRDPRYHALFDTRLDPSSQSVEEWLTEDGGGYLAAGVGGGITGHGAHVFVIDDPVKNREEAESPSQRKLVYDWYTSTAYTRLAPGGGILVIMTRWHDMDLAGAILDAAKDNPEEDWEVIVYPAVATKHEPHRKKGQALHPERYDIKALRRIKNAVGPRDWEALYQQNPVPDEGDYFKVENFRFYHPTEMPPRSEMKFYAAWDLAIGQRETNDFSAAFVVGLDLHENMWVVDHRHGRWGSHQLVEQILDLHKLWNCDITGVEHGQIAMSLGPYLDRRIQERRDFQIIIEPMRAGKSDKQARARSIQGRMQQGMVYWPDPKSAHWVSDVQREFLRFPFGAHDDRVDAAAWLGLMMNEMLAYRPPPAPKQKSWRDALDAGGPTYRSAMSA